MEVIISDEDRAKLENLKEVPTDLTDILKMGNEGKNAFDAVGIFMGADDPEIAGMLQRTHFQSFDEITTVGLLLNLSKNGFKSCWTRGGPNYVVGQWQIPELKEVVTWILQGRPSLNGQSRTEAKEALQGIKIKLANNPENKPLSGI